MHRKPLKKKPKPIVPLVCHQNVDSVSPDAAALTSSYLHKKSPNALPSTLFKSDPLPPNHEKTDEEYVGEFLWRDI